MDDSLFDAVYDAIVRNDPAFDGRFYAGVRTTRIVCRPSCRSRTPRRENITLFACLEDALKAGFRPCKRCRPEQPGPNGPDAELAERVNAMIEAHYREPLTLPSLAAALSISPFHLQRVYKRIVGMTPAKRLQDARIEAAKPLLASGSMTVADVAAAVGFRSASHFSSVFRKTVGLTPHEFRERDMGV
jgi:AraC family transcriptional regulator of adaptative response / methylphosphotriester-DNA alkyltransferase methyltransferase